MALLWQGNEHGNKVEVRSSGSVKRLYINGFLHTQYNPRQLFTRQVWDLMTLSLFMLSEDIKKPRVLVLGVGGGGCIQQILTLFPNCTIHGVDLSKVNLNLAKNFFGLTKTSVKLIHNDGIKYVEKYKGRPYDVIIDDMFMETENDIFRCIALSKSWWKKLNRILNPDGTICMNFGDLQEFQSGPLDIAQKAKGLNIESLFLLSTPSCSNRVMCTSSRTMPSDWIRKQIMAHKLLMNPIVRNNLKFRCRSLISHDSN